MSRILSPLVAALLVGQISVLAANETVRVLDGGQPRTYRVERSAASVSGSSTALHDVAKSGRAPRYLTGEFIVQLARNADVAAIESTVPGNAVRRSLRAHHYIVEAPDSPDPLKLLQRLRATPGILSAEPVIARQRIRKLIPTDPLFPSQWHLENHGLNGAVAGIDLHVTNTWNRYHGAGVVIGIVDDGLDTKHPDLAPHIDASLGYDWNERDSDPTAHPFLGDFHGTECAGAAAAVGDNDIGVTGVAFDATIAGLRLISLASTDITESEAFLYKSDQIHIKSNSWGPSDDGQTLEGPGPLALAALEEAVHSGRNGRGTIFVFPSGNGLDARDNANYDGYANSIYTIAVGSVSDQGVQTDFSEPGACVVMVTPSGSFGRPGITTTDLRSTNGVNKAGAPDDYSDLDYTGTFVGTSASVALASGGIALILNANTNLGWRDIQEILLRSSTIVDEHDPDWDLNAAGLHHNHKYGAGLMNIDSAVALALTWHNLPPQTNVSILQTNLQLTIPDNDAAGVTVDFDLADSNIRVEQVTLTATISHPYRGNLAITLTSPSGLESRLAEQHDDPGADYVEWKFMSVRHWGEASQGVWKVRVADLLPGDVGAVKSLRLDVYGTAAGEPNPVKIDSLALTDAPLGNGNGWIEPGETASARFLVHNASSNSLSGPVHVVSRTAGIELLSAPASAAIPAGAAADINFTFRVSPVVPCQSTALLELVTQFGGVARTNTFRQRIGTPPAVWSVGVVDTAGSVGAYDCLALDETGRAHISYYDAANGDLKYARQSATGWSVETVDSGGDVGTYTSLALDAFGYPHISYRDETQLRLKYAAWDGIAWQIQTVPTTVNAGSFSSLKLTGAGAPRIAFMDETNGDLLYAQWVNGAWQIQTVDSADKTGLDISLALDVNDQPRISYRNSTLGDLKYAEWEGDHWNVVTVDSQGSVGNNSSLRLGRDGAPRIAYRDSSNTDLKFARRLGGTNWITEVVDSSGAVGFDASLALDSHDQPRISYRDLGNNLLKCAVWNGAFWTLQTVDTQGAVGAYTSIALTASDAIRISYRDIANADLKFAALDALGCEVFSGLPTLTIRRQGDALLIQWPLAAAAANLESSASLTNPAWTAVPDPVLTDERLNTVQVPLTGATRFYRLRLAP